LETFCLNFQRRRFSSDWRILFAGLDAKDTQQIAQEILHERRVADPDTLALGSAIDSLPGDRLKVLDCDQVNLPFFGPGDDGGCQRVFACFLQTGN
jgi:hypothetical protein